MKQKLLRRHPEARGMNPCAGELILRVTDYELSHIQHGFIC